MSVASRARRTNKAVESPGEAHDLWEILRDLVLAVSGSNGLNSVDDVFADPQVIHRGLRVDLPDSSAKGGAIPGVRTPITIDSEPMHADRPSPALGQHTQEILREIDEA